MGPYYKCGQGILSQTFAAKAHPFKNDVDVIVKRL
jgi:hypothetical protein